MTGDPVAGSELISMELPVAVALSTGCLFFLVITGMAWVDWIARGPMAGPSTIEQDPAKPQAWMFWAFVFIVSWMIFGMWAALCWLLITVISAVTSHVIRERRSKAAP